MAGSPWGVVDSGLPATLRFSASLGPPPPRTASGHLLLPWSKHAVPHSGPRCFSGSPDCSVSCFSFQPPSGSGFRPGRLPPVQVPRARLSPPCSCHLVSHLLPSVPLASPARSALHFSRRTCRAYLCAPCASLFYFFLTWSGAWSAGAFSPQP